MTPEATLPDGAQPAPARTLDSSDYKTLALSALGGTLEFYDFVIYVFFATVLGALFFPTDMPDWLRQLQTFGIFAAGYLAAKCRAPGCSWASMCRQGATASASAC